MGWWVQFGGCLVVLWRGARGTWKVLLRGRGDEAWQVRGMVKRGEGTRHSARSTWEAHGD